MPNCSKIVLVLWKMLDGMHPRRCAFWSARHNTCFVVGYHFYTFTRIFVFLTPILKNGLSIHYYLMIEWPFMCVYILLLIFNFSLSLLPFTITLYHWNIIIIIEILSNQNSWNFKWTKKQLFQLFHSDSNRSWQVCRTSDQ